MASKLLREKVELENLNDYTYSKEVNAECEMRILPLNTTLFVGKHPV